LSPPRKKFSPRAFLLCGINFPNSDLLANPRIDNGIIDLGAIEVQQGLNIIDNHYTAKISIYPNPTEGQLHINRQGGIDIYVYSFIGQLIATFSTKVIDLSAYHAGAYIIKVEDHQGSQNTFRIIKK
jgi:hypothetical protein